MNILCLWQNTDSPLGSKQSQRKVERLKKWTKTSQPREGSQVICNIRPHACPQKTQARKQSTNKTAYTNQQASKQRSLTHSLSLALSPSHSPTHPQPPIQPTHQPTPHAPLNHISQASFALASSCLGLSVPSRQPNAESANNPMLPNGHGQYLWLYFGVDEHPFATDFDVHQGYSHSQI